MPASFSEAEVQQLMALREQQLNAEIAAAPQRAPEAPREVGDMKDEAERSALAEVADAELSRDLGELRALHAARQRLAAGHYGICEDCGEAIDGARLRAQLTATRCIACQSAAERHHGVAA